MKLQFHHHLEQLQSENISRELPCRCASELCEHNLLPRGELSIFVLWSQDNQNTTQFTLWVDYFSLPNSDQNVGRCSAQLTVEPAYMSLGSQGTLVNPNLGPACILLLQNSIPNFHLLQQLMGSLGREGHVGTRWGITSLPLIASHIWQHPQTVVSTDCVQGTSLSFKLNINKSLYSLILLSFKLYNFCTLSATCLTSMITLCNCFQCAFCETVPVIVLIPSPTENLWVHRRFLAQG